MDVGATREMGRRADTAPDEAENVANETMLPIPVRVTKQVERVEARRAQTMLVVHLVNGRHHLPF